MNNSNRCVSCGSKLTGDFCHSCGERLVSESDFSLKKITEQWLDVVSHLDSKFFLSFKKLLFSPGFLTSEYVIGRRKKYMKPLQIFILCNILFFLVISDFDIFYRPSRWFFKDSLPGIKISELAEQSAQRNQVSIEEIGVLYDNKVSGYAKGFLIIISPAFGFLCWIIFRRKVPSIGKHFIFSIHILAFFLLNCLLVYTVGSLFPAFLKWISFAKLTMSIFFVYLFFAVRKFYGQNLPVSLLKSLFLTIGLFILVIIYSNVVSTMVLMLM